MTRPSLPARVAAWLVLAASALAAVHVPAAAQGAGAAAPKVMRYAFPIAETGFDPAQISDLYSRTVAANIFEAPLAYDYLARPAMLVPQTAAELPQVNADSTHFVFRLQPGIRFADDPAFNGRPRELTAADYVYSLKRHYDPALKSPNLFLLENAKILGLSELRQEALQRKQPFDYDREVEGVRVLDRYRFEVRLAQPAPRFVHVMADGAVTGAVAREVVQAYGDRIMEHPVGTGPYRLVSWQRSSRLVLERNPHYREHRYAPHPPTGDAVSQAIAKRLAGRRLPMIDRVEVSIIEEAQPRWLAFLNGEHDLLDRLPAEFATIAVPNGRLAPNLARRGLTMDRTPLVDATFAFFNMEHPVVGGYTPDKVALRRAIAMAYDVDREIEQARHGQAMPAQAIVAPMLSGYDPTLKTEMSLHDLARARALLDLYGWVDRDGDGWRDQPDGSPLKLEFASQPDQASRQQQELWRKAMDALGVRIDFTIRKWPENLKASRAGKLMMWSVAWGGTSPDGAYYLDLMYGPNKGQANHSRFDLPAFNATYQQIARLPDGPEREALMHKAKLLGVAYMPYKVTGHRIATDLMQPHVFGYRRHPFMRDWWRYVDVEARTTVQNSP